ncbi:pyrroloquinoline quinone biosynthesis protein PqqB [Acidomonas methanolica]|uniref:Coenzyme PQQ synthesis protein B n=1 Tax=Acidomonas methanolica NBRC 104435 TaxID=1231351 RepID=A0A023D904_ACIMT|nr:pyrroloquinoline quinone biosynthesis protein PqqB [Acidomonas methanolica]MBU2655239.1 pyrroloquinoline quinone biosynthesis protein PqqB [Acidomonas methanolica]TCS25589.1 pyrroloquinoline quinone biosynthesis protein B [Acidomonas methanolica]GAJ30175.1 pyrroloquinoline quinone (PQQ) biosynthesis protein PqqB [Acidomonas methanolica NBRC 104435]GBQ51876.1 pyrroloquinoline quinone biosynthesis protein PqqB [Acidomonas methanolica]GEK98714.1 coenzyme PQQ synthesis protein B [Acidomonas met
MIEAIILGSGAGGGFPQWNSAAPGCKAAFSGAVAARTQTSLAVSGDGAHWFLLNAAPDLRAQIIATPALHPREAPRSTPIQGVLLTSGEIDAVVGLLTMRERQPFALYATDATLAQLDANPIFGALDPAIVPRRALTPGERIDLPLTTGAPSGLSATPFDVPGKAPLYVEHLPSRPGETIGLDITDGHSHLLFIPGCADITPDIRERVRKADAVFFDSTLWRDDEMIRAGLSPKTGLRMGHVSVSGPGSVLETLTEAPELRVLVHINNSNPILLPDTPERREVEKAGWLIGEDGQRFTLGVP